MTTDPRPYKMRSIVPIEGLDQTMDPWNPLTPGQQKILDAVPFDAFQSWPRRDQKTAEMEAVMDDLIANGMPFATTSTTPPTTLDLAALEKLLADIPPEPIGEWMREQGFPPETSLAILPETMRGLLPSFSWPQYVRFSAEVGAPVLMKDLARDHQVWQRYWK